MNATETPNETPNDSPFHNHVRILPMPNKPIPAITPPCKDDGSCDWPTCMSNNGTVCLFNLPDDYYDYIRTHDNNNTQTFG